MPPGRTPAYRHGASAQGTGVNRRTFLDERGEEPSKFHPQGAPLALCSGPNPPALPPSAVSVARGTRSKRERSRNRPSPWCSRRAGHVYLIEEPMPRADPAPAFFCPVHDRRAGSMVLTKSAAATPEVAVNPPPPPPASLTGTSISLLLIGAIGFDEAIINPTCARQTMWQR